MFPSAKSGLYAIRDPCLTGDKRFSTSRLTVYCDMETDGGGWIVIQRRNASMGWVNFTRNYADYEKGFGDLDGEFWIGLKNIYELTNQDDVALRMSTWNDPTWLIITWNYQSFRISDESQGYTFLSLGSNNGSSSVFTPFRHGEDSLYRFHTYDHYYIRNCGFLTQSGWWYYRDHCVEFSNLNGRHQPSGVPGADQLREGIMWYTRYSGYDYYTHAEMKIRPQSCHLSQSNSG